MFAGSEECRSRAEIKRLNRSCLESQLYRHKPPFQALHSAREGVINRDMGMRTTQASAMSCTLGWAIFRFAASGRFDILSFCHCSSPCKNGEPTSKEVHLTGHVLVRAKIDQGRSCKTCRCSGNVASRLFNAWLQRGVGHCNISTASNARICSVKLF